MRNFSLRDSLSELFSEAELSKALKVNLSVGDISMYISA